MRIDSSGNVGIGTTSPSSAAGFDAKLQLESANPMLVYKETDQSTKWEVGAWGGNYVVFNGSSERMRIDSSGNVGIGTSSPEHALSVFKDSNGNRTEIGIDNIDQRLVLGAYFESGVGQYSTIQSTNNAENSALSLVLQPDGGNVGIGTTSPSTILHVNGGGSNTLAIFESTDAGAAISFKDGNTTTNPEVDCRTNDLTINTSGTERLRIDSSGRVGIGTTSPSAPLHVVGNSYVQSGTFYTDAISAYSGSSISINAGSSHLAATVNGSERLRIDSSGNVGIGTSSPVSPLEIATTNKLGSTFTGTTNGEGLTVTQTNYTAGNYVSLVEAAFDDSGDVNPNVRIGAMFDGSGANLAFGTSNSYGSGITNTAMFINSSGNVGIGTSSPSASLHVAGTIVDNPAAVGVLAGQINNFGNVKLVGSAGGYIDFTDTSANQKGRILYTISDNSMSFRTNGANERMRIDSSGNVGIGTSSPTQKLTVTNGYGIFEGIKVGQNGTDIDSTFLGANSLLAFKLNGTERMRIDGGNVLVGTTNTSPTSTSEGLQFYKNTGEKTGRINSYQNSSNSSATRIAFYRGTSQIGSITTSSASTAYNTTSDHRLKENVTDITDGIERVKQLNPSRFNFIVDADTTVDGFLAHEAATVVPEAVTGEKDAVDADGNPDYQGIDQSKLVPLLTAALQEAITKIEDLEARVATLEGN
jgi:hypothetical protein